jgi:hypothetical protein
MNLRRLIRGVPGGSVLFAFGQAHGWASGYRPAIHAATAGILPALFLLLTTREKIYNFLWALVFGFATLNILSLGARRFETQKGGLNFGEVLAILIVFLSILLLCWEMLYVFHVLPIKLTPR